MKKLDLILTVIFCCSLLTGVTTIAASMEEATLLLFEDIPIVTIASKKAETVSEAPAIISVITAKDIEMMPYENLADIIKTVPGVTETQSFFGYTSYAFRGIMETHYNNRTLFLINGHPVREVTQAQYYLEMIPVNMIERIEIIRGPGSVIYGTNAFAGVIEITTKSGLDITQITAKGGSKNALGGNISYGKTFEDGSVTVGGMYKEDTGYKCEAEDENSREEQVGEYPRDASYVSGEQIEDDDAFETDYYNFFGNVTKGNVSLDVFHFNHQKDKFGITPVHQYTGESETTGSGATINYDSEIGEILITSTLYYSQHEQHSDLLRLGPSVNMDMNYMGKQYGIDLSGRKDLSDTVAVLAGVSYTYQETDPYTFDGTQTGPLPENYFDAFQTSYDTNDISLFSQLEIILSDPLKIVAGARFNNNKDYGSTVVPRASAVYKAADNVYIKALYGSAYRNPSFFEKYVNTTNVLYGDPDLDPEKIDTIELGANIRLEEKKHDVQITLFQETTTDKIARSELYDTGETPPSQEKELRTPSTNPTKDNIPGYGNTDGQTIMGVELEVKGELAKQLLAHRFNVSFKDGEDEATDDDIQYLDKIVANYILTLLTGDLTNSLTLHYVGEREGTISATSSVTGYGYTAGDTVKIDPYMLLNLKSEYDINGNLSIAVTVMNILAQEYSYPEYIRGNIDDIPGDSEANVYGELTYKF
ncbi:TonB-dependent receptor plug domain-containing protein [Elusimicrobiota bacterium]